MATSLLGFRGVVGISGHSVVRCEKRVDSLFIVVLWELRPTLRLLVVNAEVCNRAATNKVAVMPRQVRAVFLPATILIELARPFLRLSSSEHKGYRYLLIKLYYFTFVFEHLICRGERERGGQLEVSCNRPAAMK